MKKNFLSLIFLFFFPFIVFAAKQETFTAKHELKNSRAVDMPYTSAWFDSFGGRFILSRDWVSRDLVSTIIDNYACDATQLQARFAPDLKKGVGCKKTPTGVLLFGFLQNRVGNFVGSIYLIEGERKTLLSPDDLFVATNAGSFTIGVKSNSELFVIYQVSRINKFFTFRQGIWTEIINEELFKLRIASGMRIAWTGNAWAFSVLDKDMKLFDGRIVSDVYKAIPRLDFSMSALESDFSGEGMIAFGDRRALSIRDNGYQSGLVIESATISSQSRNAIINATLAAKTLQPSGTSLRYALSTNEGKRWYDASEGAKVLFAERDTKLRWQAFLNTADKLATPVLQEVSLIYITEDLSTKGVDERDRGRVNDLGQTQRYLQTYFNDIGKDPVIDSKLPKKTRWDSFKKTLADGARSVRRPGSYLTSLDRSFPKNPTDSDAFLYAYDADSFGKSYVLSVTLENSLASSLQNDLDGIVLGVHCNDPVYCIGQGPSIRSEVLGKKPSGRLLRAFGDHRVYVIQGPNKQWIVNPQVFEARRFRWADVETVETRELEQYPTGEPITK